MPLGLFGKIIHGIELNKEILQSKSLLIATPMYKGDCTGVYTASLIKLACILTQHEIPFEYTYIDGDALVPRARNRISIDMLNSKHTDVIMLDADIGFEAGDIILMLALNKPMVAAHYPRKTINFEKLRRAALAGKSAQELKLIASSDFVVNYFGTTFDPDLPTLVSEVGAGCLTFHRSVLEQMMYYYPDLKCRKKFDDPAYNGYYWDFFKCGKDESELYNPEDYAFCCRWRALGGSIYLCPWIQLAHRGTYEYKGSAKYAFLEGSKYNTENKEEKQIA